MYCGRSKRSKRTSTLPSPVVEARRGIGMVGAEPLFADRQGALKERPRAGEVALGSQQAREVVEARRGIGMVRTEPLVADRQGALKERPRAGEVALPRRPSGSIPRKS